MSRILVVGRNGQVASELALTLPTLGEVLCAGRELADATQPAKVRALVQDFRPDLIINASAYTAVDKAESEQASAQALNEDAVALLAELAKSANIPLIHYSTDYVFDGSGTRPWVETDAPARRASMRAPSLRARRPFELPDVRILFSEPHGFMVTSARIFTKP